LAKSARWLTLVKMNSAECLERIRPVWFTKIELCLFSDESIRQGFLEQANHFYSALVRAVSENDPSCLESVLLEWIRNRTQSEIEGRKIILAPILNTIILPIFESARETLDPIELVNLSESLLPVYMHANDFIYRHEIEHTVAHILLDVEQSTEASKKINQSKTDFISVAAHELKTPLTLLKGYTAMLRELLAASEIHHQAEIYLNGIEIGYQRLIEIVDDLIDVSMIDNNALLIVHQPVWIHQLLSTVKLEIADVVRERNLNLTIESFPGSDVMTFGDGERLLQAFRKLIFNAIKYTPDSGEVIVDGRLLPGFVEITIKDTGIGIDPVDHLRIFEKFGRLGNPSLHSSSKTKFKGGGPGLGLSITKGIIEAHGGAIWVESDGCDEITCPGSTFHVLLPMRKELPNDKAALLFRLLSKDLDDNS
jgi:signal transduction histidine kinase